MEKARVQILVTLSGITKSHVILLLEKALGEIVSKLFQSVKFSILLLEKAVSQILITLSGITKLVKLHFVAALRKDLVHILVTLSQSVKLDIVGLY